VLELYQIARELNLGQLNLVFWVLENFRPFLLLEQDRIDAIAHAMQKIGGKISVLFMQKRSSGFGP